MKSIRWMLMGFVVLATSGCFRQSEPLPPPPSGPLFCDTEEVRRFTQEEVDWRVANAPVNFKKDLNTNATWAQECVPSDGD